MERLTTEGKIFFGVLGIFLIGIIIAFIIFLQPRKEINDKKNTTSLYSEEIENKMKEINIYDKIKNQDYSKTLETILTNDVYNDKYLDEYLKINYVEFDDFINTVNTLLTKDYNSLEINYIMTNFLDDINILLSMEHINILEFKDITNYDKTKLERYLNYSKEKKLDLKTAVTYVNIGLDLNGYSSYISYTNEEVQNDLTILVNKYHKLPDDYEPNDLVSISGTNYKLRKKAADAYELLKEAAKKDNVIFYPFSAYRGFDTQKTLYNNYKNRDGEKQADTYSARPGFSEHQLGLAVDIRSNTLTSNLTNADYKWMLDNSYKYGFIIRYPKGKQHITQFIEEPWHLRYLGVELATKVHDSNLTYDEYYDLYLTKR